MDETVDRRLRRIKDGGSAYEVRALPKVTSAKDVESPSRKQVNALTAALCLTS